jgi:hypothetical protein
MSIGAAVVVCGQVVIFDEHGKQGKKILLHRGDYLQGYTLTNPLILRTLDLA